MKVLIFTAYYEPEIAASMYLSTNLFEEMANYGWEVDLFVPMPTRGISNEVRRQYKNKKLETKYDGNFRIHRFPMIREGKNPILRAIRYLIINLIFLWKGLLVPADVIFVESTPPTQGAMGAILKRLKKIPLVYNLQDIFPDSLVNTGLAKQDSFLFKIGRIIENFSYNNADKIIVISEDFKKNIMTKGVNEKKIEVVYNWVDTEAVVNITREDNKLFKKYNLKKEKFYICYSGNIGFTQNMDMLLEVAKGLEDYEDIVFVLIGNGAYKEEVDKKIHKMNINNIVVIPFQPYEDISHVFSLGDVGLIISKPNIGQNSVPSKTWSIMSAERPILASFDVHSELSAIIKRADCGICVEAGDGDQLKESILYLYNTREYTTLWGKNGRNFVINNLTRKIGTQKYINIIEKC